MPGSFDSIIANNRTTNQSIVREIRADLLRLSILANPNMATMYRNNTRKSIAESLYSSERPGELTMKTPYKIFSNITKQLHESFYLTSTGFQSIEPNLYFLVELANPLGSGKSLHLSTISGGGLLSTTIEIVIDGSFESVGTSMTISNSNTAIENDSIAMARLSIVGVDSTIGGKVIRSIIQANRMTFMDLDGRLIIAPGHFLIVRIMNQARRNNSVSLNLSWWE